MVQATRQKPSSRPIRCVRTSSSSFALGESNSHWGQQKYCSNILFVRVEEEKRDAQHAGALTAPLSLQLHSELPSFRWALQATRTRLYANPNHRLTHRQYPTSGAVMDSGLVIIKVGFGHFAFCACLNGGERVIATGSYPERVNHKYIRSTRLPFLEVRLCNPNSATNWRSSNS